MSMLGTCLKPDDSERERTLRAETPRGTNVSTSYRSKKGQTEMIGLVFVVVLLILGILVYVKFSSITGDGANRLSKQAESVQQTSSFLTALKETTIPQCRAPVERVARACIENERGFCMSGDPCLELQKTFDEIISDTLELQGLKYNLSVDDTDVMTHFMCNSSDPRVDIVSAPATEIVLTGGVGKGTLRLSLCR